ncbi:hypothetical protein [Brevibacillus agri]|uniref:hypothetical protein n=1 Tax=Brevibacillus agri TaxID=51101 RepID=UPI0025B6DAC1|nr:hypothetical protein [Brevibacillus agri]MDN4096228.1 hypothetical protein [Brevibacillus agri]MED3501919.1 hypothetical protein [Brevibacillus agri]
MSNRTDLIIDLDILPREEGNPNYPLCINISYKELKNSDIRKFFSKLKYFRNTEQGKLQNRIVIRFYGYPKEDGYEEFEIELIRKWVRKLFSLMPHLFYYLSEFFDNARKIFLCLADINAKFYLGEKIEFDFFEDETKQLVKQICHYAITYGQQENGAGIEELKGVLKRTVKPFDIGYYQLNKEFR